MTVGPAQTPQQRALNDQLRAIYNATVGPRTMHTGTSDLWRSLYCSLAVHRIQDPADARKVDCQIAAFVRQHPDQADHFREIKDQVRQRAEAYKAQEAQR